MLSGAVPLREKKLMICCCVACLLQVKKEIPVEKIVEKVVEVSA
jgi:hypothetical protein